MSVRENQINPQLSILLIDDEEESLQTLSIALQLAGFENITTCSNSRDVGNLLEKQIFSIITLDLNMPYVSGEDLLPVIFQKTPDTSVIVISAVNEIETAVNCMKQGTIDYLVKPVDKTRLITSITNAVKHWEIKQENKALKESFLSDKLKDPESFSDIKTSNSALSALFKYTEAISQTSLPILITGETGTGKELLAEAIHKASKRFGEFVPVNVAGLDDPLFSDTLFGHVKGAYSGAATNREGILKKASGGTLFLDEVGDLLPESQIKLLRLIQEKEYYPLGQDQSVSTDARLVFATNVDLEKAVQDGRFRKDLYYRLYSHHMHIPPLRKRKEDLELLINFFLTRAAEEIGRNIPSIPGQLVPLLQMYDFPGNIRELEGLIYDAVVRHESGVLSLKHFDKVLNRPDITASYKTIQMIETDDIGEAGNIFNNLETLPTLKDSGNMLVEEAMHRAEGNQTLAAKILGMTRTALNKRLNRP